jgi:hypothetical protein
VLTLILSPLGRRAHSQAPAGTPRRCCARKDTFIFMLVLAPKLGRHLLAKEERPEPGIPEWFIKSHPDYTGHLGPRTDWEVCDSFSKMIKFLLLTT